MEAANLEAGAWENGPPPDCSPSIRWLYDYWRLLHPAPAMLPGRQHIDPLDFYRLWPWIWMVDVQHAPLRFRFRLIGTEHVKPLRRDHTGRWLDEAVPELLGSPVSEGLENAAVRRAAGFHRSPSYFQYDGEVLFRPHLMAERLFLPLARDGRSVDIVLVLAMQQQMG